MQKCSIFFWRKIEKKRVQNRTVVWRLWPESCVELELTICKLIDILPCQFDSQKREREGFQKTSSILQQIEHGNRVEANSFSTSLARVNWGAGNHFLFPFSPSLISFIQGNILRNFLVWKHLRNLQFFLSHITLESKVE